MDSSALLGRLVDIDRWSVAITHKDDAGHFFPQRKEMVCFLSVGFTAHIAKKFHDLRQSSPSLTNSVGINKFWHSVYGASELFLPSFPNLHTHVTLRVDGEDVPLPENISALQVLNIHSSADSVDFWGLAQASTKADLVSETIRSPSVQDGVLEIVGTEGVGHLLRNRLKLSHSIRIRQGSEVQIKILKEVPTELDGEPFILMPGFEIDIQPKDRVRMIAGPGPTRGVPS
jgi:diacylglycerol kinase (ATP)